MVRNAPADFRPDAERPGRYRHRIGRLRIAVGRGRRGRFGNRTGGGLRGCGQRKEKSAGKRAGP